MSINREKVSCQTGVAYSLSDGHLQNNFWYHKKNTTPGSYLAPVIESGIDSQTVPIETTLGTSDVKS
jgi:hypothetical protein